MRAGRSHQGNDAPAREGAVDGGISARAASRDATATTASGTSDSGSQRNASVASANASEPAASAAGHRARSAVRA